MIYELRIYTPYPGKLSPLMRRFRDHTCGLFEKHGIKQVGYWTVAIGGRSDQLWYMLAFDDSQHMDEAWRAFGTDPEWAAVVKESEKDGPLVQYLETKILRPTNFSPDLFGG